MRIIRSLTTVSALAALASCSPSGSEDYDTGYDTSDPYGVPQQGGQDASPYQSVNPPADPSYGSAAYEEATPMPPSPPSPPAAPAASAGSHTVAKGDTLWGLSRQYGVTVDAIRSANGMASGDNNIRIGQTLNIPAQ
ncbi:LysM peptidoglycan-binding domain-containing protein [Haloferula sp. A504]|uniref:LysM peptidoglycan-binding domain-containing protein n=1 Tax=Haloferula sp. A504 TaxID=3373601 RepID=UPI0031BCC3FC|nr:LysM peptidoglycan-binding domain-containing protein [Verrucomicrobiaceae bacterium E54]